MRNDSDMLSWMLDLVGLGRKMTEQEDAEQASRLAGAILCKLRGREAVSAAMGATMIEPGEPMPPMLGTDFIAAERRRQIDVLGYDEIHDSTYRAGELAQAAAWWAMPPAALGQKTHVYYPWGELPGEKNVDRIADLSKAGALIAAEIDRLRTIDARIRKDAGGTVQTVQ